MATTAGDHASKSGLPRLASGMLFACGFAALAGSAAAGAISGPIVPNHHQRLSFVLLAVAVAVAQLFVVITPKNQSYHCSLAFLVPAIFVLPPAWLLALCVIQHLPEWIKLRYPWYIQTFNIANYTVDALAAWGAAELVMRSHLLAPETTLVAAAVAAVVSFVAVNHLLLSMMLWAARGHSLRQSGLFTFASLSTDLAVAGCGIVLLGLWTGDRWLAAATLATLFLIQRSLSVPALEQETRLDPKTGLFNATHFLAELSEELERSMRFERPLSIVMADLDLLRDINNTFGHLAGDTVLNGIAEIMQEEVRSYDLAARFGGEEFALLLPETTLEEATEIADRVRVKLANTRFTIPGHRRAIRATISCGIAGFPAHMSDATGLIQAADEALYASKSNGRNRVSVAPSPEPESDGFDAAVAQLVDRSPARA